MSLTTSDEEDGASARPEKDDAMSAFSIETRGGMPRGGD